MKNHSIHVQFLLDHYDHYCLAGNVRCWLVVDKKVVVCIESMGHQINQSLLSSKVIVIKCLIEWDLNQCLLSNVYWLRGNTHTHTLLGRLDTPVRIPPTEAIYFFKRHSHHEGILLQPARNVLLLGCPINIWGVTG